uniref:Uncharacterized protein n=2 Tax=unclassified bacterial viruses TaxID=12333 RepID=A0AAU7J8C4_9VIRU
MRRRRTPSRRRPIPTRRPRPAPPGVTPRPRSTRTGLCRRSVTTMCRSWRTGARSSPTSSPAPSGTSASGRGCPATGASR